MPNNMTSLKIVDNRDKLDAEGYIGLTDDFLEFSQLPGGEDLYDVFINKRKRSFDFIDGTWPTSKNKRKVVWQDAKGNNLKIDSKTNRIRVRANEGKDSEGLQKTVVSVPEEPISNVNYLDKYIDFIWEQKDCKWDEKTPEDVIDEAREKAAKFLFGMLLITRCR